MSDLAKQLIQKEIKERTGTLTLSNCNLADLKNEVPELFELAWLKELTITPMKPGDKPILKIDTIGKLSNLTRLCFLGYSFNDMSPIKELKNLKYLQIGYSDIPDLYFLYALKKIELFSIYGSKRIVDITPLSHLSNLSFLNLKGTSIEDLSPLKNLKKLWIVDLSDTNISDLSPLSDHDNISILDVSNTRVTNIRPILPIMKKAIPIVTNATFFRVDEYIESALFLENTPLKTPPPEIVKQGNAAILSWFSANKKRLNEIKVILIGEPEAGKTSLLRRLKDGSFDEKERPTDGINIESIGFGECGTFEEQKSLHKIKGHFWDFGGQEIMNSTHQFFLTNRAVYILVLTARRDTAVSSQINKWVRRIGATGGDSPIIVVANKSDENPGFGFENEEELKKGFPQIKYFVKLSCKENTNIDLLKGYLEKVIPQAKLFHTDIDEKWFPVKEALEEETKSKRFLDETRFRELCIEKGGISDKNQQKSLISFLHDLGLVLHFDEIHTAEYFVLDPYWITYGVYQILTSRRSANNNGLVPLDKLDYIINEEKEKAQAYKVKDFKKIKYSSNQRLFLVDILQQFKLCFYTPDRRSFIIPDLLDTKEPIGATEDFIGENTVQFIYKYAYLPSFIMPKIMVETHPSRTQRWRTGCILKKEKSSALIKSYNDQIFIYVNGSGNKKRELMAVLRHLIDSINRDMPERPEMHIPLPGTSETVDYQELIEREKDGEQFYTLYKPEKKKFEIAVLLGGMPGMEEVRKADVEILKEGMEELKAGQKTITKKMETYFYLQLNAQQRERYNSLLSEIEKTGDENIFAEGEQKTFFEKIEKHINGLPEEERNKYGNWQNQAIKHKLKVVLPLVLFKYEAEMDVSKFKLPKKWGDIKAWFINKK